MRWPDFFIVGAPKAGTTTLDSWLRRMPGVSMARRKEPLYFAQSLDLSSFLRKPPSSLDAYLALWPDDEGAIRGEASPPYLVAPKAPQEIAEVAPNAKVIISMRDPVSRAFSHFRFRELRTGKSDRSFGEAIRAYVDAAVEDYARSYLLEPGYYGRQLQRWKAYFDDVHVVFFDHIVSVPHQVVADLAQFLGIDAPYNIESVLTSAAQNNASQLKWPWTRAVTQSPIIRTLVRSVGLDELAVRLGDRFLLATTEKAVPSPEDREFLEELYFEDQELLRSILLSDLPWFDGQWVRTEARRF